MVYSRKVVERYNELKEAVPDCLLLMQVGVFMQVMDDDARAASEVTGLKLQMAGEVDAPVVLGGFPKSGLDAYVGKLVRAGHYRSFGNPTPRPPPRDTGRGSEGEGCIVQS